MGDTMGVRFLSPEWLDRLRQATGAAAPDAALSVHQRVTGGPEGDVEYVLRVAGGRVRFEPGAPADRVDVALTTDYPTAAAISQGALSPAAAFAAGRMRVAGSLAALVASQEAVAAIGDLLAGVAEATTY
jgi:hypothetical protein